MNFKTKISTHCTRNQTNMPQLSTRALRNVEVNEAWALLMKVWSNPYSVDNPTGIVAMGVAENKLMWFSFTSYLRNRILITHLRHEEVADYLTTHISVTSKSTSNSPFFPFFLLTLSSALLRRWTIWLPRPPTSSGEVCQQPLLPASNRGFRPNYHYQRSRVRNRCASILYRGARRWGVDCAAIICWVSWGFER